MAFLPFVVTVFSTYFLDQTIMHYVSSRNLTYCFKIIQRNQFDGIQLICLDSTSINWKLWTILQSWLCFHIIVLSDGTILPRKTTSCSRVLRDFSSFDKMFVHLTLQTCFALLCNNRKDEIVYQHNYVKT